MLNCALPCCCVMFLLKLGVGRSYATLLCTYSLHKTDVEMGMRMWHEHGAVGGVIETTGARFRVGVGALGIR